MTYRRLQRDLKEWQTLHQLQSIDLEVAQAELDRLREQRAELASKLQILQQDWDYAVALQAREFVLRSELMNFLNTQHQKIESTRQQLAENQKALDVQIDRVQQLELSRKLMHREQTLVQSELTIKHWDAQELQLQELSGVCYANSNR